MSARRHGFTLIELLVVIAIIAILAAILFPVFARAREAARRSVCLSNCKQLALGLLMYVEDYDEATPLSYTYNAPSSTPGTNADWYILIMPYLKNTGILFCPDRTVWIDGRDATEIANNVYDENTADGSCFDGVGLDGTLNPQAAAKRCLGYGYNWGPGPSRTGVMSQTGNVVTLASIPYPADTFGFGDTDDVVRQTIKPQYMEQYYQGTNNSGLRHGGMFNIGFMDGHAKAVAMKVGFVPWNAGVPWALPKMSNLLHGFCSDPSLGVSGWHGYTGTCGGACDFINASGTWFTD